MRKLLIIGDMILDDEKYADTITSMGFTPLRFKGLKQSMQHLSDTSVIVVESTLSSDGAFGEFIKAAIHIPKIIFVKTCPPKGLTKWLKGNMVYPSMDPGTRVLGFLLRKAATDRETSLRLEYAEKGLSSAEKELSLLEDISKTITSSLDLHGIIITIMKHIRDMTGAKEWSLYLLDDESRSLYLEKSSKKISKKNRKVTLGMGEGIAGWVASEGTPVIIPDISSDKRFLSCVDSKERATKKSIICVPLKSKDRILGALEISNKQKGLSFTRDDLAFVLKLVDHASIAIERASLYQKMAELAITDDLTKLFNSRYLNRTIETEISRCERYKSSVSLIFMDVDHFKSVNDQYGHLIGSKLLVETGQLLIKGLRSFDIVTRYGGDEFVIVLPQTAPNIAVQIAERLRKNIKKHIFLKDDSLNLKLTASFGIASYPENAGTKDELIHLADEAMYRVKNKTRDGVYAIAHK